MWVLEAEHLSPYLVTSYFPYLSLVGMHLANNQYILAIIIVDAFSLFLAKQTMLDNLCILLSHLVTLPPFSTTT